ncbi:glycoside hydrolase family 3 N-terminal domain-containing protein [Cellulomonas fimi]|uniref:Glycoside hydrolase family 3 domain protein n=1 Tax=Cellulomonas fimi (strain ATCC 484 / DSM 20113 / JCM 1341 / CCUG 24087 / LMG 16345 / NBRC 15513 / NCIMB 8980 / NCTC 7547 / NRS-133) TaxID=590998 RepID=F4H120_CELFA|nr:glycoside hydrolase family 3 N-terminal domain-containing protein [Cellulomonas fimi]AEE47389.1 glycoside hydrolase family 3 domain protein [Cellulomonas fimi ATCC 484]VEH36083.1 Periplasmic beta-glucosidase precursor [Cellulomonas fimi]
MTDAPTPAWRDEALSADERADALVAAMTLDEKVSQLVGLWVGADASGAGVAPHQAEMTADGLGWSEVIADGLGQLTRPFGSAPVDPVAGARSLAASQAEIAAANRFGIPALVHEECLAGFAAWKATAYPVPLSWGASFDPELVERMAGRIGATMRAAGVHQGLAPVLDVTRDYRWGRTEETIGEDPYLVATVGTAYVRGLEQAGVVATLKHFAGYSASRAGRNLAPVSIGPRELADVILPPFEMAVREGGARSVMHSYAELDGVPSAADRRLLTTLLRDTWGFDGTLVADYFGIRFLHTLHGVAADDAHAATLALTAGVDVELPSVHCYGTPLRAALARGDVDEALVDRALRRVLRQKAELGLLDAGWDPLPADVDGLTLDDDEGRDLALRLARESVVLVTNPHAALPLAPGARVAVVGPLADDPYAMLGCYSFPAHVGVHHPDHAIGIDIPTVLGALRDAGVATTTARGCDVTDADRSGFTEAVEQARAADVVLAVVGDRAGLFGRGTSGEGCDATDLRLPGVQADLVRALLDTGTPVVLLLLTGRPYALGDLATRAAAVVQAFFPGQRGGQALAEVLTGAVSPSGRLPVSLPADPSGQPGTYLSQPLGRRTQVSDVDPTPAYAFGHGLSYASFDWDARLVGGPDWAVDGEALVEVDVTNTSTTAGADVVQLYLHDPVAQVTRPVVRLVGYGRVALAPGERARLTFTVPADVTAFTGLHGTRVVEPGDVELRVARSSADVHTTLAARLVGAERTVDHTRHLVTHVTVTSDAPEVVPA